MKLKQIRGKRGNAGMSLMVGLITSVLVFMMLSAFMPSIISMLGTVKGSNAANCPGYTDPNLAYNGVNNVSYTTAKQTDQIVCSIINFTPGMYILTIIFAVIFGIIAGKFAQEPQQPYYAPQN